MPFASPPRGEGIWQLPLLTPPEPRLRTAGPLWSFGSIHLGSAEEPPWPGGVPSRQAWLSRWQEEGPCRGCSSPGYLPLPGTAGLRGNLRVRRNMWGTLAGWECVSKRFNRRASCPAGLFSKSSVHGSPWFSVKGSFWCSQVKHICFQEPPAWERMLSWPLQCHRLEEGFFPRMCSGCWQHLSKAQKHHDQNHNHLMPIYTLPWNQTRWADWGLFPKRWL